MSDKDIIALQTVSNIEILYKKFIVWKCAFHWPMDMRVRSSDYRVTHVFILNDLVKDGNISKTIGIYMWTTSQNLVRLLWVSIPALKTRSGNTNMTRNKFATSPLLSCFLANSSLFPESKTKNASPNMLHRIWTILFEKVA